MLAHAVDGSTLWQQATQGRSLTEPNPNQGNKNGCCMSLASQGRGGGGVAPGASGDGFMEGVQDEYPETKHSNARDKLGQVYGVPMEYEA